MSIISLYTLLISWNILMMTAQATMTQPMMSPLLKLPRNVEGNTTDNIKLMLNTQTWITISWVSTKALEMDW